MKDIFGTALRDYLDGNYTEDIMTETSISEEDVLPLPYLFRTYEEMPEIEQKALDLSHGVILDAGCGSGCHALELQHRGLEVKAIDTSPGAIDVAERRGLKHTELTALADLKNESYDTILMLMNGAGLLGPLEDLAANLAHTKSLLNKQGQVLVDSSDLIYMYDQTEEGGVLVPADHYYGELDYTVSYKGEKDEPFKWLYLDPRLFAAYADEAGFNFEIIVEGDNFDYLARLTHKN